MMVMKQLSLFSLVMVTFTFSCKKESTPTSEVSRTELIHNVYYGEMRESMEGDYDHYLYIAKKFTDLNPNNPFFQYHLSRAHYLAGNSATGYETLKSHVSQIHSTAYVLSDSVLMAQLNKEEIDDIKSLITLSGPEKEENVAFEIKEKGFTAEGLAVNPITKSIYLGSIRLGKIIEIDSTGVIHDFTKEYQFEIDNILGFEVDQNGESLYACGEQRDSTKQQLKSGVFRFDLADGSIINAFFPADTLSHEFNDLTIVNHKVYVTDSRSGGLYIIYNDKIETFISPNELSLTNGITKSDDEQFLYIADMFFGVMKYNLSTKQQTWLKMPEDFTLTSIDGLSYYEGGLIAHQFTLNGIYYYTLEGDSVINKSTISNNHPLLKDHTTGDILNDTYYFIANSDIDILNTYGKDVSVDSLNNTIILKQTLKLFN